MISASSFDTQKKYFWKRSLHHFILKKNYITSYFSQIHALAIYEILKASQNERDSNPRFSGLGRGRGRDDHKATPPPGLHSTVYKIEVLRLNTSLLNIPTYERAEL
jgi:hypothetical protein